MGAAAPGEAIPLHEPQARIRGRAGAGAPERRSSAPKSQARAAAAAALSPARDVVGRGRQFADRAAGMRGGRLFPLRRAYDILVRDRLVIALLLALEIKVADAERAGAIIDPEHAALLLVAGRDQAVVARLLLRRAVAAAVAVGDPERARADVGSPRIVGELAGDHVAGQFIEPIDQGKIDLRRGEKLVLGAPPRRPQPRRRRVAANPNREILADIADLRAPQITSGQAGAERLHKSLRLTLRAARPSRRLSRGGGVAGRFSAVRLQSRPGLTRLSAVDAAGRNYLALMVLPVGGAVGGSAIDP